MNDWYVKKKKQQKEKKLVIISSIGAESGPNSINLEVSFFRNENEKIKRKTWKRPDIVHRGIWSANGMEITATRKHATQFF